MTEGREPSRVQVVEDDDGLSIEVARLGWDLDSGIMLFGGLVLLLVGLLRTLALPDVPAMVTWSFPLLGAWLVWRGLGSHFISTRIVLKPSSGMVESSLGPLCSFSEINGGTLDVQSKVDDDGEVDLRIFFSEPRGKERIVRLLRGYSTGECDQVVAALRAWTENHRIS